MGKILEILMQLKEALSINKGEILSMTLDKAGKDAINDECRKLCGHLSTGVCPTCGRVNINNEILGIKIL